jgi:uncharacterized protein YbjT (DUF2867 family)
MRNILVTGGTGTLGKVVVNKLVNQNSKVSILSSKENVKFPNGVKLFTGNLETGDGLYEAIKDVEVIIHCASNSKNFQGVDIIGTKNLLGAINNKIHHFIYISIVGIDKSDFPYYLAKLEVEEMIQKSGIPYSILRATQFHNLVLFLIKSFQVENGSSIIVPERMKFQTIDIRDVADKLVKLAGENPMGKLSDLGGPQVLDLEEMTKIYLKSIKKEDIKVKFQQVESELYNVFKSGINLCPQNALGKITWEEFLGN